MIFVLLLATLAFSCGSANGIITVKGKTCTIPFVYKGVTYKHCTSVADTRPWCAIGPKNYRVGSKQWQYCCPDMSKCNLDCSNRGGFAVSGFCKNCKCNKKAYLGSAAEILVFRQNEGCGGDPQTIWSGSSSDSSTPNMKKCNWKSPLVEKWKSLAIYRVIFGLYNTAGEEVKRVVFDGRNTDKNNWFTKSRIIQSSWSDLGKGSATNYDSIVGWKGGKMQRSFYFQHNYGGCPKDAGWFGVTSGGHPCFYEAGALPVIMFASTITRSLSSNFDRAAEFRIYIKRIPKD